MSFPYRFKYELNGSPENPVILLLHGFLGGKDDWTEITDRLCENFLTVTVDLPGHGYTQVNGIDKYYTMPSCAWGMINFLDQLKIKKCHLVGYSMGGRLALYLAVNYPVRFDKIIIESSSPGLKTAVESKARIKSDKILSRRLETENFEDFLNDWYRQPLFESMPKDTRFKKLFKKRLKSDPLLLAKSLRQMGTGAQPSLWAELVKIQAPILFIAGDKDEKFKALAYAMSDLCKRAEISIINNCGHNVHFEKPLEFYEQLNNFLIK
ncbi:MAG: 2-succinyl-6-hydroxy-2,4-cyclohexadiene-1-carboxylate synthase [candidate division Zixibacteria bacterium]|nr:2-succinyl-6-hydroxy-2,4-cyclohexadiene-1-carboxylate synthase [candidate division Zixibacteria bacterium]